jgi:tRNA 2-thiouridine synthesizing protein B
MPILHIVNKSPYERHSLDTCLRLARDDAALLLIEDAVYAVRKNAVAADQLHSALGKHKVYALEPDLQARGIDAENTIDGVELVDYDGFVELATEYDKLQSWL